MDILINDGLIDNNLFFTIIFMTCIICICAFILYKAINGKLNDYPFILNNDDFDYINDNYFDYINNNYFDYINDIETINNHNNEIKKKID